MTNGAGGRMSAALQFHQSSQNMLIYLVNNIKPGGLFGTLKDKIKIEYDLEN